MNPEQNQKEADRQNKENQKYSDRISSEQNSWEEDFEKTFYYAKKGVNMPKLHTRVEYVKDFIRETLSSQKQHIVSALEGMKDANQPPQAGWNQAILAAIDIAQKST